MSLRKDNAKACSRFSQLQTPIPIGPAHFALYSHGPMILVIDNYDSFTWNLVHYLMELGAEVEVVRNVAI